VSDEILAAKLKAYKKTKTGSSRLGLLERSTRTGSSWTDLHGSGSSWTDTRTDTRNWSSWADTRIEL